MAKYIRCIVEAEEDHPGHMKLKNNAAELLNRKPDELKNKKYKNAESGRKADLKYDYKENIQQQKRTIRKPNAEKNHYLYRLSEDKPKPSQESDIRKIKYMRKNLDMSNPKEVQKYNAMFKSICNKYGIDENSSLYIHTYPGGKDDKRNIWFGEVPESKKIGKKELKPNDKNETEHKFTLPNGYALIHTSGEDNLTELKPTKFSDKYSFSNGIDGRYHLTGRVYFVLVKENDINVGKFNYGKNVYKLTSNISGFYLDYEGEKMKNLDKYPDISKLVGKPVYVKSDKPLKVTKIR